MCIKGIDFIPQARIQEREGEDCNSSTLEAVRVGMGIPGAGDETLDVTLPP